MSDPTVLNAAETYAIYLTESEMKCLARCMANYFDMLAKQKISVPPKYASTAMQAFQKMKKALDGQSIVLVQ